MKKRWIAVLCMAALLIGLLASGAVATETAETFLVGYSRVDINPYVDPTLTGSAKFADSNVMHLPLRGSGSVWQRPSTKFVDDNYDGVIDENDGLAVTCVAIQSGEKVILMITIDLIGSKLISEVRQEICSRVAKECGVTIAEDAIFYAGTHTHTAPDTTVVGNRASNNNKCVGTDGTKYDFTYAQMDAQLATWIDRTVVNVGTAAVNAVNDLEAAELIKDEIDADDYTNETMNSTRHYYYDPDTTVFGDEYYYGDNFNYRVPGSTTNYVEQAHEVDDVMYLLKFQFADGSRKLPVVIASWRGHPSLNNTDSYNNSSRTGISSDYVNAFRYKVEASGYRVAFFQATGGNVNPRGYEYNTETGARAYSWIDNGATKAKTSRGNFYGNALGEMALQGLTDGKNEQVVEAGPIQTSQVVYYGVRKQVTELAYKAAVAYNNGELTANSPASTYTYTDPDTGETYTIASAFHASNIIGDWDSEKNATERTPTKMELNAILLGEGLAFVTAPGEPFDYYNAYDAQGNPYNAWEDLIDTQTYGKPIILGYCNGAVGYIPSYEAYEYNKDTLNTTVAVGSYEAHCTSVEQGTGEKMVEILGQMLDSLSSGKGLTYKGTCAHCSGTVTWQPYNAQTTLSTGHYYLLNDCGTTTITIANGSTVCFDMNGYTLTGQRRAFDQSSGTESTLNLMDLSQEQTGVIQGTGGKCGGATGWGGGVIFSDSGNILNLYSGTVRFLKVPAYSVTAGGTVRTKGTFNMYGGTVIGGEVTTFTGSYISGGVTKEVTATGRGGTIATSGKVNLYGGTVTSGVHRSVVGTVENSVNLETVTDVEGNVSGCIYVYSGANVTLSGDVRVDDIYCVNLSTGVTVSGEFTGRATVSGSETPAVGTVVGVSSNASIPGQTVYIANTDLVAEVSGNELVAVEKRAVSVYDSATDTYVSYDSLAQALEHHTDSTTCLVLTRDLTDNVTLTRDVYLDLNGYDVTGNINNTGHTLYCMDSKTDDYTVADASGELTGYGKLYGTVSGSLEPVPEGAPISAEEGGYRAGYLMLARDGAVSFHRINLDVRYLYFVPGEVSMYYESVFAGDEVVAANVESFGVAVSIRGEPQVVGGDLSGDCLYSSYTGDHFVAGMKDDSQLSATGSKLVNIITTSNTTQQNQTNAATQVYGCSYIKLADQCVLGPVKSISLRQSVETLDGSACYWGAILTAQIVNMYQTYAKVMSAWDIPNIIAAAN